MILAELLDDIGVRNVMKAYESNLGHDGLILGHAHFKDINIMKVELHVWNGLKQWKPVCW